MNPQIFIEKMRIFIENNIFMKKIVLIIILAFIISCEPQELEPKQNLVDPQDVEVPSSPDKNPDHEEEYE